jgi:hypothetical protein
VPVTRPVTIHRLSVFRAQPYLQLEISGATLMNGWKLARLVPVGVVAVLSACAAAPPAHQEMSILDALDAQRSNLGPASCAALNTASVCEKSTRLDRGRNCGCSDPHAIADGTASRL